ncbi:MAG TPA: FHA domain-containing protein [Bryobacteraceae bacterium]|jgi:hypothetical protein|nr:FHA domain-containing protein [Bryobacteraceae bacterium]
MNKILIRHLSGERAQQADEFAAFGFRELIVGRDPSAQVRFDPDRDDLVSRQHLKIVADPNLPNGFLVVDLQSRNGTFINHQRVFGSQRVGYGDIIQLGPGGPEIRFELEPPPAEGIGLLTRETTGSFGMLKPTRESLPPPHGMSADSGAPRPVGRATVERMLGDVFTRVSGESRKGMWIGAAALVAILAVGGGTWMFLRQSAADAAAAQKQSQAGLQQVNEELAKNPALIKSMREEIARLQEQLRNSQDRNDSALQSLSKSIAKVDSAVQQVGAQTKPGVQAGQPAGERLQQAPPGAPQGQPPAPASDEFTRLTAEATRLIDQNKTAESMEVARQLIRMDASRYEGYALGGISAFLGNQYGEAVTLLQQASVKAPPERRQQYEDLVKQCQQAMAGTGQPNQN